jgi:cell wall-associated NlpC family hydrolase
MEHTQAGDMILWLLKQVGESYLLGAEGPAAEDMKVWDCSELVQHAIASQGIEKIALGDSETCVSTFDGAAFQFKKSRQIPLKDGIMTPGALLFCQSKKSYPGKPMNIGHVAVSLGNGYVIEARGRAYGVVISPIRPAFNLATKIDELYQPS